MISARHIFISLAVLCSVWPAALAQQNNSAGMVPIAKYITAGDHESLSAWFADNLEVSILGKTSNASKAQAKQIVKSFFERFTPREYHITHTAGRPEMKYVLGDLNAGGEIFHITLFLNCTGKEFEIEQFKVDRF